MASNKVKENNTPTSRRAAVWKYFGFKKDSSDHLWVNHPALYKELCSPSESSSSKQHTMDKFLHSFPSVGKLSPSSLAARMLSDAIVEFIAHETS